VNDEDRAVQAAARGKPMGRRCWLCLGTALAATPLLPYFDLANIAMLFLLAVVGVAVRYGRGPAVLAAVVNVVAFDFFFVPSALLARGPRLAISADLRGDADCRLVVGQLTARSAIRPRSPRSRATRPLSLRDVARTVRGADRRAGDRNQRALRRGQLPGQARLLLPDDQDRLQPPPVRPGKPKVDLAIAQWCFDRNDAAGLGTDTLPAASLLYLPLKAPLRTRGVLAVAPEQRRLLMIPEQRRLLDTFAALIAIALERVHFAGRPRHPGENGRRSGSATPCWRRCPTICARR
jgi:two-component system sensor histidine kinase KdpD